MRFKIDENMATEVAVFLRSQGHDAMSVVEQDMAGAEDPELAAVIQGEQRILATLDLDFADIRRYPPSEYAGLLVFRVRRRDPDSLLGIWKQLLIYLEQQEVAGELWIVEDHGIRRREA